MTKETRLATTFAAAFILCGCHGSDPDTDAGLADAGADAAPQDAATSEPDVGLPRKTLGFPCVTGEECASGFCADQVCCDTSCEAQCFSCRETGAVGTCAPILGPDPTAALPCTDTASCVLDSSGMSACRLNNGERCSSDEACASGNCRTYYLDGDGDGYGATATSFSRCDALTASAPAGYSLVPGDCCDLDGGAHPGLSASAYFTVADACASFDWDCSGAAEKQATSTCSGSTTPLACGSSCTVTLLGLPLKVFTQACR